MQKVKEAARSYLDCTLETTMSDKDHDLLITQFQDITGQDAERSRFYLESSGWDVEMALGSFYENF